MYSLVAMINSKLLLGKNSFIRLVKASPLIEILLITPVLISSSLRQSNNFTIFSVGLAGEAEFQKVVSISSGETIVFIPKYSYK